MPESISSTAVEAKVERAIWFGGGVCIAPGLAGAGDPAPAAWAAWSGIAFGLLTLLTSFAPALRHSGRQAVPRGAAVAIVAHLVAVTQGWFWAAAGIAACAALLVLMSRRTPAAGLEDEGDAGSAPAQSGSSPAGAPDPEQLTPAMSLRPACFIWPVVLVACASPPAAQSGTLAEEPGDSALAARCQSSAVSSAIDARISAGRYVLTLVASDGSAPDASAYGTLWLHPAADSDRSPRSGRGPSYTGIGAEEYLFGATSLDFSRIGAPVEMEPGDTIPPPPTSTDPVRPGVLVSRRNSGTVVLIGTLNNMRDARNWLDGAGIGLHVRHISDERFSGIWSGWGTVPSREGFFCAVKTHT